MSLPATHKYKTISSPGTGDFRDRGSKFLAFAWPVATISDVKVHLAGLKKEHPKAVHHCYAYRLGHTGVNFRANDDGEPSGSAGKPILGQIDSQGLTNVLVVVVRYFGGTLLGIPGLINAYRTATLAALDPLSVTEKNVEIGYHLSFDYPVMGEVLYQLKQNHCTITAQEQGLFCQVTAGIPVQNLEHTVARLGEIKNLTLEKVAQDA